MDFDDLNWEKKPYSPLKAYCQSKLANILFTKELAQRIADKNIEAVTVYSLHPGVIATELGRHLDKSYFLPLIWMWRNVATFFIKTPIQGAQTTIYCAVDEKCANETGLYYSDCRPVKPAKQALITEDGQRLWDESLKLVGLETDFDPFNTDNKWAVLSNKSDPTE